jgi:hypothetical protein
MARREIPGSTGAAAAAASPLPWEAIYEINERSIELLVQMARSAANSLMLPPTIRDLLRQAPPEARKRAAARAYTLIDLDFRNLPWWEAVRRSPEKQFTGHAGRKGLPKRSAVPLARILLTATREAIRADMEIARLVLGIEPQVADLLSGLQITQIDRIAGHQFRHIEFRWFDRPAVWRSLLLSVAKPDKIKERQFDAHCLQLLIGDVLPNGT